MVGDPQITIGDLDLWGVEPETSVRWIVPKNGLDWSGAAGSTVTTKQRPRGHGGWAGKGYLTARSYSLSGVVSGPTRAAVEDALDRLAAAAGLDDTVLTVAEDGRTRFATVRRDDEIVPSWMNDTTARFATGLVAPDPRKFGGALSVTTALPSTTGGLSVPLAVPFSIDAVTVTGQVSLTNPGNIAGPVRLRIDGPVTGPVVTHVSSGRSLVFASSVVLTAGQWIDVDMERREVLANGQSGRNGWVTQRGWSQFEPGANTWAFTAVSYNAGSRLTVSATPAWM